MLNNFVKTGNVDRFLDAIGATEDRGAREASLMLAEGDAGLGKSRTGAWWAAQHDAIHIRIKAAATPHWVLADIVRELGNTAPAHTCEKLFAQAVGILAKEPRPIVVDEVENALGDIKVIETIRDLSDILDLTVVMIGREYVQGKLRRHRQIWTRIAAVAHFEPATSADVEKCCKELSEVEIAKDLQAEILRQSEGHIRQIVKAIANLERIARRHNARAMTLEMVKGLNLTHDRVNGRRRAAA